MSRLFHPSRVCVCCERRATSHHRIEGEPLIVSISFVIYYRGAGKRILKAARKVQICSECLARALAEPKLWHGSEGRKFNAAIRESLAERYSDILEEDALSQVHRPGTEPGELDLFEAKP